MNSIFTRFRFPTLLGLAIIVLGTGAGVYLTLQRQTVTSRASVDNTPKNIKVSSLTDTGAIITWQTQSKIQSFVTYGVNSPTEVKVDDRDSNQPTPRLTHIVTLSNLTPQTTYQYKITAGQFNSGVLNFTTAGSTTTANNLTPIIGSVLDGNQPLSDGLVFLIIPGANVQATSIKSLGNFVIPMSGVRTEDLSAVFSSSGVGKIEVLSEDGRTANATINLNNPEPIGPLKLGQTLDLTIKPSPLGISTSKFDINGDGIVNTGDYATVNGMIQKKKYDIKADLNSDKLVNKKDLDLISAEIKKGN